MRDINADVLVREACGHNPEPPVLPRRLSPFLAISCAVFLSTVSLTISPPVATAGEARAVDRADRETTGERGGNEKHDARDRLEREYERLKRDGRLEKASGIEKKIEIEQLLFGEFHPRVADSLESLARLHEKQEDFRTALACRRRVLGIRQKHHGKDHWRVVDARYAMAEAEAMSHRSKQDRSLLRKAEELRKQVGHLRYTDRAKDALPVIKEVYAIRERILGKEHRATIDSLNVMAGVYMAANQYERAEPLFKKAIQLRRKVLGKNHPGYAHSLSELAELYRFLQDWRRAEPLVREALEIRKTQLGEKSLPYSTSLYDLGWLLVSRAEVAEAASAFEESLEIRRSIYGSESPRIASCLEALGAVYELLGDFSRAEELLCESLTLRKKRYGTDHSQYLRSVLFLARLYKRVGDYDRAEWLYREILDARKKAVGQGHPKYADVLESLGYLYRYMGDFDRAELFYRDALEIRRKTQGKKHADYARVLSHLASLYLASGDYPRAERLFGEALAIEEGAVGKSHVFYSDVLHNLALTYHALGDSGRAKPLLVQVLEIRKEFLGRTDSDAMVTLAAVTNALGDYQGAAVLLREVIALREKRSGKETLWYADALRRLARLHFVHGDYSAAEPLYRDVLAICRRAFGDGHPGVADHLDDLARVSFGLGDFEQSRMMFEEALRIHQKHLGLTFAAFSHRQQLMLASQRRATLDGYLSLGLAAHLPVEDVFKQVLAWRGGAFSRLYRLRLMQHRPELKSLFRDLRRAASRLSTLVFSAPPSGDSLKRENWRRQIAELTDKKEHLEGTISRRSAELYGTKKPAQHGLGALRSALGSDAALVDFFAFRHSRPSGVSEAGKEKREKHAETKKTWKREGRLLAFVLRGERPVVLIDLGPLASVEEAVDAWRNSIIERDTSDSEAGALRDEKKGTPSRDKPIVRLAQLVWNPLRDHVDGARHLLICPDVALQRFPFGALPGKKPGTYLIEEIAISTVTVPQLLPELLARAGRVRPEKAGNTAAHDSLLLVGDVDFDSEPDESLPVEIASDKPVPPAGEARTFSRTAPRGGTLFSFEPLESTRGEILSVRDSFERMHREGKLRILRGRQASEAAFRERAPHYRYLHVATHGFFAPPELKSAMASPENSTDFQSFEFGEGVVGWDPGILSGIVFSGANRKPKLDKDDGIFTAVEMAELDLTSTELLVLSGCETGLGTAATGEGLLGLQGSAQAAGARAVVASLWKVDDVDTAQLMARFYENLWTKKMGKLEALRDAQLSILRGGTARSLGKPVDAKAPTIPARRHPRAWAAWVLSGDWR